MGRASAFEVQALVLQINTGLTREAKLMLMAFAIGKQTKRETE